jgi:hypothetical protein
MKLVWRSCGACGSEWEDIERGSIDPYCAECGSRRIETLLFGGEKRAPDFRRVPRPERIEGLAWLLGTKALAFARESGDWDYRASEGDDPNDLEAEYWLASYRPTVERTLTTEEITLTKDEEDAAATAFREGWDWAVGPLDE